MSNKPGYSYGIDRELEEKLAAKYDPVLEAEALEWIAAMTGMTKKADESVHQFLKNGVVLCKLMNRLQPESIKKINESSMAFKQMENIGNFLDAAQAFGVPRHDLFQTVDLYEDKNMVQVVLAIYALGGRAQKNRFNGPVIGVKHADANKRDFDEEVMNAAKNVVPQQAGFNKGANQSGIIFGGKREIIKNV